jgi:pyroglutamyl-peptidase
MKTVLLTGFGPFGGDPFNPTAEIARQLDGAVIAEREVIGAVLPCVFGKATTELKRLVELRRPALVICLGLAAGRTAITPERIAINVTDARIPDNAGRQPVDEPVVRGGPVAYWSTLPIKAIAVALWARGIPAEVSQSAGTFVCNHVFYGLMHQLAPMRSRIRGGFIHVPGLPNETADQPGLPLGEMTVGIRLAIETSLRLRRDIREAARALD